MNAKAKQEAQNPLILRCHRLMDAFAKSDDERDFYIDRLEGFLIYVDLDKSETDLEALETEVHTHSDRYCLIPKLSFYETKKIMEGFVNEKVYDIDTKEKLLDIIQSKEARENFLEFIYDHHSEHEKWQQYYQERSRIRIIEWLRQNHFLFVFEEDLELPRNLIEKLKQSLFLPRVGKDVLNARKSLVAKAKTYYSSEALNPRPKRGRPPKQAAKPEIEPQVTTDIYLTVPAAVRPFLFTPDLNLSSAFSAFSSKFNLEEDTVANRRNLLSDQEHSLNQKLASLRNLSSRWIDPPSPTLSQKEREPLESTNFDEEDEDEDENFEEHSKPKKRSHSSKDKPKAKPTKVKAKNPPAKATKPKAKRIMPIAKKDHAIRNKSKPLKKIMPKNQKQ
jgi:hypothetical protein